MLKPHWPVLFVTAAQNTKAENWLEGHTRCHGWGLELGRAVLLKAGKGWMVQRSHLPRGGLHPSLTVSCTIGRKGGGLEHIERKATKMVKAFKIPSHEDETELLEILIGRSKDPEAVRDSSWNDESPAS